ncbi:MAG: hypothetical protein MZV70_04815 [Desulfobacterales bacterium]|nr:hypothetical protein [Desulfobacterales bacterium]
MATDQPTTPNIPRPNQTVSSFCALPLIAPGLLRADLPGEGLGDLAAASRWVSAVRHPCFPELHEAAEKVDLQLRRSGPGLLFPFVDLLELLSPRRP